MPEEERKPIEIPTETATETDEQRAARNLETIRHRVAMLMDELKRIFVPEMVLSFIARNPYDPQSYTLLTEEKDMNNLIDFLQTANRPQPIPRDTPQGVN